MTQQMYLVSETIGDCDGLVSLHPLCLIDNLDEQHIKNTLIKEKIKLERFRSSKWYVDYECGEKICYDYDDIENPEYTEYQKIIDEIESDDIEEYLDKLPFNVLVEIHASKNDCLSYLDYDCCGPIQIFPIKLV